MGIWGGHRARCQRACQRADVFQINRTHEGRKEPTPFESPSLLVRKRIMIVAFACYRVWPLSKCPLSERSPGAVPEDPPRLS